MHFNFYASNSSIRSHIKFSWRCRYIPFDCCYCISLSSIQSLVNPSNFTFCCRVRVHNATDLHFFLFFIEKSHVPSSNSSIKIRRRTIFPKKRFRILNSFRKRLKEFFIHWKKFRKRFSTHIFKKMTVGHVCSLNSFY